MWPGRAQAREVALAELWVTRAPSLHVEAIDRARGLAREPYAAQWAGSLRRGGGEAAEEDALHERTRRIPRPDLERDRGARAELALTCPASSQLHLYHQKHAAYARRIVGRDNARFRTREAPRPRSRGCCERCAKGRPCGSSCTSRSHPFHQPPGCACGGGTPQYDGCSTALLRSGWG